MSNFTPTSITIPKFKTKIPKVNTRDVICINDREDILRGVIKHANQVFEELNKNNETK